MTSATPSSREATTSAAVAAEIYVAVFVNSNSNNVNNYYNNESENGTGMGRGGYTMPPSQSYIQYLEMTSPVVCLVGTVLNLLTVGAFLSKSLRRISCCLYLATRSLAVFGFLVSMFIAWSNSFAPLMNTEGVCEVTVFLSYFCPFISVWMVVIISVENFIRIAQPSRVSKLCTPRVAKFVIMVFVILGLVVYNFPLWTSRVVNGSCDTLPDYIEAVLVLNYIDAALTLLCPFALMIVVVPLVGLSAIHAYERKKRLSGGTEAARKRPQSHDSKSSPEARVTHLLLAVSVVFLLLHTPFHAIRIKVFIQALTETRRSRNDDIMHHVFRLIYNLDTCVSCAVYLIFGDNFRKVFCNMYFSRCHRTTTTAPPEISGATSVTTACPRSPRPPNNCAHDASSVKNGDIIRADDTDLKDEEFQARERLLSANHV